MSESPIELAVVIGSVRQARFGPTVAKWFAAEADAHDTVRVDLIDLLDYPLPLSIPAFGQAPEPSVAEVHGRLGARLAAADAFVVVTPEYNHTVPAGLKNAIDWYNAEWMAKPVGLVSYGGMGGGLRAAEHLRQIFAEVHAVTVRDMISFHNVWGEFTEAGVPADAEAAGVAAKKLIDQLVWWAQALREARERRPYAG
ncbi:NADPH-dependent FMN reductase [Nocardia noduli]|uniref:NADPH-dependent FMN reductase n=1 Tax=Nocardia noduli TaxID=2815722 RepID=UPI001C24E10E|nr:NAD(P)H-dependent oxidoreductase [Nocardia noduli]